MRFGKKREPLHDVADPVLPMLSVAQADELTALLHAGLVALGHAPIHPERGVVEIGEGQVLGMYNLATVAAQTPQPEWPELVEHHLRVMFASFADTSEHTPEQVLFKLRPAADLGRPPSYPAEEVLPGVLAILAIDFPEYVKELLSLDSLGSTWEEARELALANLAELPEMERQDLLADPDRPASVVHLLSSEDFFGAARLLLLDQILLKLGIDPHTQGVLLAVPNRHLIAIHPLTGLEVVTASSLLGRIAVDESEGPGPLTSDVFYIDPSGVRQRAMYLDPDGALVMEVQGALHDRFLELGLLTE